MASKTGTDASSIQDVEDALDALDQTLDRLKTLYEQYFLGIQKQAPAFLHTDVERKLRDLTQQNIRNTGLRYRLATLQQKFGSYNSYWRRTLRQIENGTYLRNLAKIGREAAKSGSHIPEEILAAMPKRMREQVIRDRDAAIAIAKRRKQVEDGMGEDGLLELDDAAGQLPPEADDVAAMINEPSVLKRELKTKSGAHVLSADDGEMDFDAFFSAFEDDAPKPEKKPTPATQQITMPLGRVRPDTEPDLTLEGDPAAPTQAMPVMPRGATPTAMPTSAIGRIIPTPARPTSAIPRPPGATPPTPTAIPQPIGAQPSGPTSAIPRPIQGQPSGAVPTPQRPTPSMPVAGRQTGPVPIVARQTGPIPTIPAIPSPGGTPAGRDTGAVPTLPNQQRTQAIPRVPVPASQASRPNPIAPGSAARTGPVEVESMSGPFPREQPPSPAAPPAQRPTPGPASATPVARITPTQVPARPTPMPGQPQQRPTPATPPPRAQTQPGPGKPPSPPAAPMRPPPGMTEADVNALHAKYVQAKQMVGEKVDASSREKLLKTINQTAPKIMEQYKASGVDFSVVVKDNQVVIKAKPKT
ncbi:MAG TPA: MXAN_5187 C-terminal domain-containing protein [Kofleriaceae bacterium]|nr:MXAN_5187 C-terminal domain-containing protein [Kofleriaceae bacterium]